MSTSPSPSPAKPRLRLRLTPDAERQLRGGHPWVYADSIRAENRPGETGELAIIYDRENTFFGIGLYDADSPIRLRRLHVGKPQTIDTAWWQQRLLLAWKQRTDLCDANTNGYRLLNGESDGWPGLVLDRYANTLVLKTYTAAWLVRLPEIVRLIQDNLPALPSPPLAPGPVTFIFRCSRNMDEAAREWGFSDGQVLSAEAAPPENPEKFSTVEFLESGLKFEAEVQRGQKTGFFLDQRDNRRLVETYAAGRNVLNAFSFSGGFSLYAARGGAKAVTSLDISAHALASAKRNFALNQSLPTVAACPHETVQGDVFAWLPENNRREFDLVILDPPSLAKREPERAEAIRAYERLAADGIEMLPKQGILVAASCSAHVTADEFFGAVRQAARQSRRPFEELTTTGHAPDHPARFKEALYLKAIYLRM